jgi:hypothetical protein
VSSSERSEEGLVNTGGPIQRWIGPLFFMVPKRTLAGVTSNGSQSQHGRHRGKVPDAFLVAYFFRLKTAT